MQSTGPCVCTVQDSLQIFIEDVRMKKGLEIILSPLFIIGQPLAPMLRMRGWRRGWRPH
jgi:hypothetical protein